MGRSATKSENDGIGLGRRDGETPCVGPFCDSVQSNLQAGYRFC